MDIKHVYIWQAFDLKHIFGNTFIANRYMQGIVRLNSLVVVNKMYIFVPQTSHSLVPITTVNKSELVNTWQWTISCQIILNDPTTSPQLFYANLKNVECLFNNTILENTVTGCTLKSLRWFPQDFHTLRKQCSIVHCNYMILLC